jgi:hypothetical protein
MVMKPSDGSLIDTIQSLNLYRTLTQGRADVELWHDNIPEDGWELFRIVTLNRDTATVLVDLRAKEGRVERRVTDEHGVETWLEAT